MFEEHVLSEFQFRMGELFSGPGGMALGARRAAASVDGVELQHAWANDYDRDTCFTYRNNILVPAYGDRAVVGRIRRRAA